MTHPAIRYCFIASALLLSLTGCKKGAPSDDSSGVQVDQAASSGQAERQHGRRPSFDELDVNKDGKVTADEAKDAWKFLSKADTNNDGAVTKEEMDAFHPHKQNN